MLPCNTSADWPPEPVRRMGQHVRKNKGAKNSTGDLIYFPLGNDVTCSFPSCILRKTLECDVTLFSDGQRRVSASRLRPCVNGLNMLLNFKEFDVSPKQ